MGIVNCQRCGGAWWADGDIGLVKTNGELCPVCRDMETAPPVVEAKPWALTEAAVSAHDALEDLLNEVWKDEANWALDDKIDLALGIHRVEPKKGKA